MKRIHLAIAVVSLAVAISASANIVINFDDRPTGASPLPAAYAGFTWSGWATYDGANYTAVYNNTYANPSSPIFAFNGSGTMTVSAASAKFDFIGADVSTWAQYNAFQTYSSRTITAQGYLNNIAVGAPVTVNLSSTSFNWWQPNILGIDKLVLSSDGNGRWWTLDNFTYNPVPEPTTMIAGALLLLPFGASTLRMLRRSRTA